MKKSVPVLLFLAVLVAAALWGWGAERKAARDLQACQANLKALGTALESYSADTSGRYPALRGSAPEGEPALRRLVPRYLQTLPVCPAAGEDTYSRTYTEDHGLDGYLFWCSGSHHGDVHPARSWVRGLTGTLEELREAYREDIHGGDLPPGEPPYPSPRAAPPGP